MAISLSYKSIWSKPQINITFHAGVTLSQKKNNWKDLMGKTPIDHKREEEKREIIIMMSQIGGKKDTQLQYKY